MLSSINAFDQRHHFPGVPRLHWTSKCHLTVNVIIITRPTWVIISSSHGDSHSRLFVKMEAWDWICLLLMTPNVQPSIWREWVMILWNWLLLVRLRLRSLYSTPRIHCLRTTKSTNMCNGAECASSLLDWAQLFNNSSFYKRTTSWHSAVARQTRIKSGSWPLRGSFSLNHNSRAQHIIAYPRLNKPLTARGIVGCLRSLQGRRSIYQRCNSHARLASWHNLVRLIITTLE